MTEFNLSFQEYLDHTNWGVEVDNMPDGMIEVIDNYLDIEKSDDDKVNALSELGQQCRWFGQWMTAKASGYKLLKERGLEGLKNGSEKIQTLSDKTSQTIEGLWCFRSGEPEDENVVFVFHDGLFDTALADGGGKIKNERIAKFWLGQMDYGKEALS